MALYYGTKYLLGFADNDQERRAIRRWVRDYAIVSTVFALGAIAAAFFTAGWQAIVAVGLAGLLVLNYQLLVQLPRFMNPMLARDAQRRPEGASRRRMTYRLVWGSTGILIANIGLIAAFTVALLSSGRMGW